MLTFTHPDRFAFDEKKNLLSSSVGKLAGPKFGPSLMANTGTMLVEQTAL
jgi:hypothetical protein